MRSVVAAKVTINTNVFMVSASLLESYGIDAPHFRTKLFGWRKNTGPATKGAAKGI